MYFVDVLDLYHRWSFGKIDKIPTLMDAKIETMKYYHSTHCLAIRVLYMPIDRGPEYLCFEMGKEK